MMKQGKTTTMPTFRTLTLLERVTLVEYVMRRDRLDADRALSWCRTLDPVALILTLDEAQKECV